jgi:glycine/D-amino acid oxidase-like deaminating enzyme
VASSLDGATVLRESACYLPCADTGAIVAGRLRDGVYVATGHTCWGILNGPATGQGMAELMLNGPDGKAAQLLAPFAPRVWEDALWWVCWWVCWWECEI